ncbi:unnamed protein product, partial [Mesorhabditis spiculigera]
MSEFSDSSLPSLNSPDGREDDEESDEMDEDVKKLTLLPSTSSSYRTLNHEEKPKKPRSEAPALCAICGGQANGYHYEAPSCNSCKTFFRRVMLRARLPQCKKMNGGGDRRCPDKQKNGRAVCRGCRFVKCLEAGMDCRGIEYRPGAPVDDEFIGIVLRMQFKARGQADTADDQKPSTSQALVPVNVDIKPPLSNESDHFRTLIFLKSMEMDMNLRLRLESPEGLLPWPMQNVATYMAHGLHSQRIPATAIDAKYHYVERRFGCAHFLIEYERAHEIARQLPFYDKLGTMDKVLWFRFAAMASFLFTSAFRSKSRGLPAVTLRDGSLAPILAHNPWELHRLIFFKPVEYLTDQDVDDDEFLMLRGILLCSTVAPLPPEALKGLDETREKLARTLFAYETTRHGMQRGANRYQLLLHVVNNFVKLTGQHKELYLMGRLRALASPPPISLLPAYTDTFVVEIMGE